MAGKPPKNPEATWPADYPDMAVSEFTSVNTGAQSPFGDDVVFPLAVDELLYKHPSRADRPNLR